MEAGGADASSIECVPFMPACAKPSIFVAGRPATEWAADAWGAGVLPLLSLAVWNDDRIVRERTHARYYDPR
jgi:hypothetical protein